MRIVWDEPKRQANLDKHGFDFADFDAAFVFDDLIMRPARPSRSGRSRFILIGRWREGNRADRVVTAIVSPLGSEALALVSLRIASAKERDAYDKA